MRGNSHVSFLEGWSGSNPGLATLQAIHVGQRKLQVRLAGDMDEKFLERLGHILKLETPC